MSVKPREPLGLHKGITEVSASLLTVSMNSQQSGNGLPWREPWVVPTSGDPSPGWLPLMDSNHDRRIQSAASCR